MRKDSNSPTIPKRMEETSGKIPNLPWFKRRFARHLCINRIEFCWWNICIGGIRKRISQVIWSIWTAANDWGMYQNPLIWIRSGILNSRSECYLRRPKWLRIFLWRSSIGRIFQKRVSCCENQGSSTGSVWASGEMESCKINLRIISWFIRILIKN